MALVGLTPCETVDPLMEATKWWVLIVYDGCILACFKAVYLFTFLLRYGAVCTFCLTAQLILSCHLILCSAVCLQRVLVSVFVAGESLYC